MFRSRTILLNVRNFLDVNLRPDRFRPVGSRAVAEREAAEAVCASDSEERALDSARSIRRRSMDVSRPNPAD